MATERNGTVLDSLGEKNPTLGIFYSLSGDLRMRRAHADKKNNEELFVGVSHEVISN
jgi:hypothetical protein